MLDMLRKIIFLEGIYGLQVVVTVFLYPILLGLSVIHCFRKFVGTFKAKKSISGDVAVITGAAGGLGRDIAIALAQRGCHVAIVDIQGELAKETAEFIAEAYKVKAKSYQVDVSDYQQLTDLRTKVSQDLGDVTILINNAGVLMFSNMESPPPQEVQRMINVNLTAIIYTTQIFLPKMKELNRGHIVNISSISSLFPNFSYNVYAATKAAVRHLTSSLRIELMQDNYQISATTAMPTFLNTNKQVKDVWSCLGGDRFFPTADGDVTALYVVNAMLNGDDEVTVPRVFLYLYKMSEFLHIHIRERLISLGNTYVVKFDYNLVHKILRR